MVNSCWGHRGNAQSTAEVHAARAQKAGDAELTGEAVQIVQEAQLVADLAHFSLHCCLVGCSDTQMGCTAQQSQSFSADSSGLADLGFHFAAVSVVPCRQAGCLQQC